MSNSTKAAIQAGSRLPEIYHQVGAVSAHVTSEEARINGSMDRAFAGIGRFRREYTVDLSGEHSPAAA